MKSYMFTLLSLIIGVFFFQPTHQYRLSKRELTEYDLTHFIVNTCSADKIDMLIQNLCDQTLQSALMGNFPFLMYYCKTIGVGMNYCNNINRYAILDQNPETKRSASRRRVRSLNGAKKFSQLRQKMDMNTDFEIQLIMQICLTKIEESSWDAIEFCNRTLEERSSDIEHFCKHHPDFDYCRLARSSPSFLMWPWSSNHPMKTSSFVSSSKSHTAEMDPNNEQQNQANIINKEKLSSTSPTPLSSS